MRLYYSSNTKRYVFACPYSDRDIAIRVGFHFDKTQVYTYELHVALRLREYADESLKKLFERRIINVTPWPHAIEKAIPKGLELRKFQPKIIKFGLERNRSYWGVDPGGGKTICAAVLCNALRKAGIKNTAFYVCPPFLTSNTDEEFSVWCGEEKSLILLPDSMLTKQKDLYKRIEMEKIRGNLPVLFIDEAHRFKNLTAQRSKYLYEKILPHFDKVIFMSGTPLPNSRPMELFPVLYHAAHDSISFMGHFDFGRRFCGAHRNQFGWDFSGFTNRTEFIKRIQAPTGKFMIRVRKNEFGLPPKVEGLLTVGQGIPPVVSKLEKKILAHYSPEDLTHGKILKQQKTDDMHIATYLRLLGEYKLKFVLPYIEAILNETTENIILFGVHKETLRKLAHHLRKWKPLVITGDVPKAKRQPLVKKFQTSKKRRVFIGNIQACGVGFTLTKATRAIFIEFSWVDGDNSQAADRIHRIGQDQSVFVQYVVLKDSFDRQRMEIVLNKRKKSI